MAHPADTGFFLMKVLMISTDLKIFDSTSEVRRRVLEYGNLVEELHVIVYAGIKHQISSIRVGGNIFLYPTNTWFKPLYFWDAYEIGKNIIQDSKLSHSVITTQDPFETALVGYWLKKKFNIPLQIQVHTDFLSPYFWRQSWKNTIRRFWWGTRLLKKADGIRVVSERVKNSLVQKNIPENRIVILPIFVDKERFARATAINEYGKDFLILTVARLEPEKNLFLAIDVVAEVLRQYPETRYTIIGQGSLLDRLIIKIKSLSVGDRITIKQVNINDLPSWYKRANLFLLTSNYEGYSMAIIESAAAGIPVVTTDVGVALGEVLPVKNKSRLVEVTNGLVSNPEKCKELIEKQNEFFKNWPTKERWLAAIKDSWEQCSNE